MGKINEILFIVHPGFDTAEQLELESNIKSKIDELSEGIKKGIDNIIVFVDEPGITKMDLTYDNIRFLNNNIQEYFAFKSLEQFHRNSFPEEVINKLIDEKISRFVYDNLEILLKDDLLKMPKLANVYEINPVLQKIEQDKFEELLKILLDKIIQEEPILDYNYKNLKLSDISNFSSKIPENLERRKSLYYYAVSKLGEERIIQSFMHDSDLSRYDFCKLDINDIHYSFIQDNLKIIQKNIFDERIESVTRFLTENNIKKFSIGGEYLGRCVSNFSYLIQGSLGYIDNDFYKFVDPNISLIKKGDENRFKDK